MNNNTVIFENGDYVKCKTWDGREFLGLFEYYYVNGSQSVVDVRSGIHYNVRKHDIQLAQEDDIDLIKILAKANDIVAKEPPSCVKLTHTKKQQQESELALILKPITELI